MPSNDMLIPFFLAAAIFACVPGPGMAFAAAQTIAGGHRTGWFSAIGLHIGGYFHIAAAAFGLALLLKAIPVLYLAVKLAGAAYLVWLGLKLFLTAGAVAVLPTTVKPAAGRRTVGQSVVVEILNPKTALFYLAFLPQFTDTDAALPVWAQVLILGTIVNVMFSATDVVCVVLAHRVRSLLAASARANRVARRIGGSILMALGVNLALARS